MKFAVTLRRPFVNEENLILNPTNIFRNKQTNKQNFKHTKLFQFSALVTKQHRAPEVALMKPLLGDNLCKLKSSLMIVSENTNIAMGKTSCCLASD